MRKQHRHEVGRGGFVSVALAQSFMRREGREMLRQSRLYSEMVQLLHRLGVVEVYCFPRVTRFAREGVLTSG